MYNKVTIENYARRLYENLVPKRWNRGRIH